MSCDSQHRLQVFRPSWDLLLLARCKGNAAHPNKQTSVRKSSPDWQIGTSWEMVGIERVHFLLPRGETEAENCLLDSRERTETYVPPFVVCELTRGSRIASLFRLECCRRDGCEWFWEYTFQSIGVTSFCRVTVPQTLDVRTYVRSVATKLILTVNPSSFLRAVRDTRRIHGNVTSIHSWMVD